MSSIASGRSSRSLDHECVQPYCDDTSSVAASPTEPSGITVKPIATGGALAWITRAYHAPAIFATASGTVYSSPSCQIDCRALGCNAYVMSSFEPAIAHLRSRPVVVATALPSWRHSTIHGNVGV